MSIEISEAGNLSLMDWFKQGIGYFLLQKYCSCHCRIPDCCSSSWHVNLAEFWFVWLTEQYYTSIEGETLAITRGLEQTNSFTLRCCNLTIGTDHSSKSLEIGCLARYQTPDSSIFQTLPSHLSHGIILLRRPRRMLTCWPCMKLFAMGLPTMLVIYLPLPNAGSTVIVSINLMVLLFTMIVQSCHVLFDLPFWWYYIQLIKECCWWEHKHEHCVLAQNDWGHWLHQKELHRLLVNAPSQPPTVTPSAPLSIPFEKVFADFFDCIRQHYLVVGDHLSGWWDVFTSPHGSPQSGTSSLICCLHNYFAYFGVCEISSNGGPELVTAMMNDFLSHWGVAQRLSFAYYPQSNGWVEVAVNSTKHLLCSNTGPSGSLDTDRFLYAIVQICNAPNLDCNTSPVQIIFGWSIRDAFAFSSCLVKYRNHHIRPIWCSKLVIVPISKTMLVTA